MFSWCQNRLEITGKSVCLDVMQPWIAGTEKPLYRHAIRQAIKLFLAGCAGILKARQSGGLRTVSDADRIRYWRTDLTQPGLPALYRVA